MKVSRYICRLLFRFSLEKRSNINSNDIHHHSICITTVIDGQKEKKTKRLQMLIARWGKRDRKSTLITSNKREMKEVMCK